MEAGQSMANLEEKVDKPQIIFLLVMLMVILQSLILEFQEKRKIQREQVLPKEDQNKELCSGEIKEEK